METQRKAQNGATKSNKRNHDNQNQTKGFSLSHAHFSEQTSCMCALEDTMRIQRQPKKLESFDPVAQEQDQTSSVRNCHNKINFSSDEIMRENQSCTTKSTVLATQQKTENRWQQNLRAAASELGRAVERDQSQKSPTSKIVHEEKKNHEQSSTGSRTTVEKTETHEQRK
jgi:hypothetical protein